MLWVDKHRPHALDKFTLANQDTASHLKRLVADGDCPHLLFYGVSGAGKKTLALAVLRELGIANIAQIEPTLRSVSKGIPIKKLMLVVEMALADGKNIHPGRFAATLQETGLLDP